jgi:hypothetical protein
MRESRRVNGHPRHGSVGLLLGLDHLIGLHIDVQFMAFALLVHDLHFAEAFALLGFVRDTCNGVS